MTDDPRLLEAADFVKSNADKPATDKDIELAADMLRELDLLDPLRRLLTDEHQAVRMFVPILSEWRPFVAGDGFMSIGMKEPRTPEQVAAELLAVLREVAGL